MNKFLRYSFIALLALVSNVTFGQEVTLDFTNNTNWKFPDGSTKAQQDATDFHRWDIHRYRRCPKSLLLAF